MKLKLGLFLKEAVLFGATLAIGIFSAYRYSISPVTGTLPDIKFGWSDVVFLILVTLFFFLASRYKKLGKISYRIFLVLVIFSGTQIVAGSFFSQLNNLLIIILVMMSFLLMRNVLGHNIGVIFGIAGIGSILGLSISTQTAVLIMVVLSLYDIIAVYVTKHMVVMAKTMIESGAIFGLIVPSKMKGFLSNKNDAHSRIGEDFMILGSGDIGLPVILTSSIVSYSVVGAIIVAGFSLAGLLLTHLIFVNQSERKPMAALPPIATMSIIGYLLTIII